MYRQIHQGDVPHKVEGYYYTRAGCGNPCLQPDSPPILNSVRNDAECNAIEIANKPLTSKADRNSYYTVGVAKAKIIPLHPITPTSVIAAVGGLVAVDPMRDFGERRCCIRILELIYVTLRIHFTVG